jgi:hypothetical protein
MFARTAALLLLTCLAKAESASDKSWKNLGHAIKQSSCTVAMRDGRCATGHIESFDDKYVTVDSFRLDRKDIVRVGDGTGITDHDPIYSGRSSWSDLQRSEPNKYEPIQLELKNHITRNCGNFSATEEEATCDGSRIGKAEVARGYYIRLAPASEWEHHVARENVTFLAPRMWFDETLPQENVKLACKVP